MPDRRAIDLALDLARMPSLAPLMREQPLPPDLLNVIRIAAGCPDTSKDAAAETELSPVMIKEAVVLYLQEVLFFPDAGPHRNLGVCHGASRGQMRLHMRWLLQWLHPDHNADETAALLATRVINAWRELGSGGVRLTARPDITIRQMGADQQSPGRTHSRRRAPMRVRWIAVPLQSVPPTRRRGRRAIVLVLAAAAALALIFLPDGALFGWRSLRGAVDLTLTSASNGGAEGAALIGSGRE